MLGAVRKGVGGYPNGFGDIVAIAIIAIAIMAEG
jgi:hypothetical protein